MKLSGSRFDITWQRSDVTQSNTLAATNMLLRSSTDDAPRRLWIRFYSQLHARAVASIGRQTHLQHVDPLARRGPSTAPAHASGPTLFCTAKRAAPYRSAPATTPPWRTATTPTQPGCRSLADPFRCGRWTLCTCCGAWSSPRCVFLPCAATAAEPGPGPDPDPAAAPDVPCEATARAGRRPTVTSPRSTARKGQVTWDA